MVFSSLFFVYLFLPACLLLYFITPDIRLRNGTLLLFSLVFYSWGEPKLIILLLITSFICYLSGYLIHLASTPLKRRLYLIAGVALTLSFLAYFKYWGFLLNNINYIFRSNLPYKEIVLPLGISFYTFQALTYVIDMYRNEVNVQKSYFKFLLYISLFPQLVAGPIVRYSDIAEQIDKRSVSVNQFTKGIIRFITGLGKKVIIANTLGKLSSRLIEGKELEGASVLGAWVGIFAFALQIYYDFSAYSDMAIGLGNMFGFKFNENFNYPYISNSITEFWRRWHISLSTFFRDYVYIPLGGNRKHQILNLFIVWFLTGLWHGASWNFILWGLYFFVFLVLEKRYLLKFFNRFKIVGRIYMAFVVLFGWVIFYFTDMSQVGNMFKIMFGFASRPFSNVINELVIGEYVFYLVIGIIGCIPIAKACVNIQSALYKKSIAGQRIVVMLNIIYILFVLLISSALLAAQSYNPFLYFRF